MEFQLLKDGNCARSRLHEAIWWGLLLFCSAFRVWLVSAQTPHIIAGAGHDDALFVTLSENLLNGLWLGHGNDLTLAKGAFFPIFLALNNAYLGLKYITSLQLLYVCSGLLVVCALRRAGFGRVGLFVLFTLFIFNPSLASLNARRLVRDSLYTSLLVMMMGFSFGLCDALFRKRGTLLWAIGLGLSLGALWATREEGMALIPPLMLLAVGSIVLSRRFVAPILAILSVVISGLIIPVTILALNYSYYGVAILTEMQSEYFTHAYGALNRVKHDHWRQYVPVPKHVREKIYKVSPAFESISSFLEASSWVTPGCRYINPCDDLSSHFVWGFRKAVVQSRYYASLEDARLFYMRLASEVDAACESGRLDCLAARSSLVPPYRDEYRQQLIDSYIEAWRYLISFEGLDPYNLVWSPSDPRSLKRIGQLLNYRALNQVEQRAVSGWIVSRTSAPLDLFIASSDGQLMSQAASFSPGPTVNAVVKKKFGVELPATERVRFEVGTSCLDSCLLWVVDKQSGKEAMFALDSNQTFGPQMIGDLYFSINALSTNRAASSRRTWRFEVLDAIWPLYQIWIHPLLYVGIVGLSLALFRFRHDKRRSMALLLALALLAAICTRLALLTYIHVTSFHAINDLYCMPCYALLLLFIGVGLAVLSDGVISLINRWRTKSNLQS